MKDQYNMKWTRRGAQLWASLALIASALTLSAGSWAQAAAPTNWQEGVHYHRLTVPVGTENPDKIEVVEVFSYACIHCFNFEPMIRRWADAQAADVTVLRTPAVFQRGWDVLAQGFYTAQALGMLDQIHDPMFVAMHQQRRNMTDVREMAGLFVEFGVSEEDFSKVFNAFGVRAAVRQADARVRSYRVNAVPSMIVDGRFRVDAGSAGSEENMLAVVDALVEETRAQRERDRLRGIGQ